jgi:beta-xylosidase
MLHAEGSQLMKHDGKYYLFNITWPRNGMRTVVLHRADKITGPYEGRVALQDRGIAQGCIIDTPEGDWYAYMFRDFGAVGRIPYLMPMKWEDGWPVLGIDGKVPDTLDIPVKNIGVKKIVASDEFKRKSGDNKLPLAWQWNHNPDNRFWSLNQRKGHLRLTTGRVDTDVLQSRNMLTQRTFGPECSASISLDVSNMKEGDCTGFIALQRRYGYVGVKMENGAKYIVMVSAETTSLLNLNVLYWQQERLF